MTNDSVYFMEPDPDGLELITIAKYLRDRGYSLTYGTKDALLMEGAKQILKDQGATRILSRQLLTEEVLPDNSPRGLLLDTLTYKLDRCAPTTSMLLIDPYLYPLSHDHSYESDLTTVLGPIVSKVALIRVATLKKRDANLEARIEASMRSINSAIRIEKKYTNIFHDRFWIADDARGLFLGTSLNGIGKRYALIDYLSEQDTLDIVQRYNTVAVV
jgi:hypothetical protein